MDDSQAQFRNERLSMPTLDHVASPSPVKARRRQATERPALSTAGMGPVKLPSELFAIATSRNSQGDMALSKALDGIQAAATRLETERTKLVIQSQELQIWDMAREEELVLLRAENEQLEQQLALVSDKVNKGLGRDGVLESLQFALRKARNEREAEMREADVLFNHLQEAKAAAEELRELRAVLVTALGNLDDEWSALPLVSDEARELRARADAAIKDPTNLSQGEVKILLQGLLSLAARGSELQRDVQTLCGEKAALQLALDAAQQQIVEQAEQLRLAGGAPLSPPLPDGVPTALAVEGRQAETAAKAVESSPHSRKELQREADAEQQRRHEELVALLQRQVSELESKLAEYRSFLADNQEEIESLQNEVRQLRQGHQRQPTEQAAADSKHSQLQASKAAAPAGRGTQASARASQPAPVATARAVIKFGSGIGSAANDFSAVPTSQRLEEREQQQRQSLKRTPPQQVAGTPTRHVPSSSSPISTVNYGASPPPPISPSARGSPAHVVDFAQKVAELQDLARRAQQQATEREEELFKQHEQGLAAVRAELAQQKAAERAVLSQEHARQLAEAMARQEELERQHAAAIAALEAEVAARAQRDAQVHTELAAQLARLSAEHGRSLTDQEGQTAQLLKQRETELQQLHAEALAQQACLAEDSLAASLVEQAARLAHGHAEALQELKSRLEQEHAQREDELEARLAAQYTQRSQELSMRLERQHAEHLARREVEMREKHSERLAEQAAQLALLHAEQAAALGMQHAEKLADMEAQLLQQFELRLAERESHLTQVHAEKMRELEATASARGTAAWEERDARLRQQQSEELVQALEQQRAALTTEADGRLEQLGRLHLEEVTRVSQLHQDELKRQQIEATRQLEEHRLRVQELEQLLQEAQGRLTAQAAAVAAAGAGRPALQQEVANRDQEIAALTQRNVQLQAAVDRADQNQLEAVAAVERQCVEVVARLGREHEQASAEARAVRDLREANLRRALERQAEEAQTVQRKQSDRLREMQDHVAELRALLEKEREHHATVGEALKARVAKLASQLEVARVEAVQLQCGEGKHRGASSSDRTPSGGTRVSVQAGSGGSRAGTFTASPSTSASSRELQQQQQQHPGATSLQEAPGHAPVDAAALRAATMSTAPVGPPVTPPTAAQTAEPFADAWDDGQLLIWPESSVEVPGSHPGATGEAADPDFLDDLFSGAASFSAPGVPREQTGVRQDGAGTVGSVRRSDQDLAANLIRALKVLEADSGAPGGSGANARIWGTSLELKDKKAPRQGLLQRFDATASSMAPPALSAAADAKTFSAGAIVTTGAGSATPGPENGGHGGVSAGARPALGEQSGEGTACGTPASGRAASSPWSRPPLPPLRSASPLSASRPPGSAEGHRGLSPLRSLSSGRLRRLRPGKRSTTGSDHEWGELVGAPSGCGVVERSGGSISAFDPAYTSGAATSVSTTSSYNSETEFYVDDEDEEDDELRGRALAAALAQSPRSSQTFPLDPPPAVLEIQERRRSQSPGPSSPSEAAINSTVRSGSESPSSSPLGGTRRWPPLADIGDGDASEQGYGVGHSGADESVSGDMQVPILGPLPPLAHRRRRMDAFELEAPAEGSNDPTSGFGSERAAVDLDVTLAGPFPVLSPPVSLADDLPLSADEAPAAPKPTALPQCESFSFSRRNREEGQALADTGREDTTSSGDEGSNTDGDGGRSEGGGNQLQMPDMTSSFDFSSGGKLWPPEPNDTATSFGSARASDGLWPGMGDQYSRASASGDQPHRQPDLDASPRDRKAGGVDGGGSVGGGGVGSISFDSSSSDSAFSSPDHAASSSAAPASGPRAWVTNGTADRRDSREATSSPAGDDSPAIASSRGGGSVGRAPRLPLGVLPLMAPNPLYDDTGEPSPPWSTADWGTPRESPSVPVGNETSLPSTPDSDSSGGEGSSEDSSGEDGASKAPEADPETPAALGASSRGGRPGAEAIGGAGGDDDEDAEGTLASSGRYASAWDGTPGPCADVARREGPRDDAPRVDEDDDARSLLGARAAASAGGGSAGGWATRPTRWPIPWTYCA